MTLNFNGYFYHELFEHNNLKPNFALLLFNRFDLDSDSEGGMSIDVNIFLVQTQQILKIGLDKHKLSMVNEKRCEKGWKIDFNFFLFLDLL